MKMRKLHVEVAGYELYCEDGADVDKIRNILKYKNRKSEKESVDFLKNIMGL